MNPATTKEGQMESLRLILSKSLTLRLFENNIEPDYYNTVNDYKEVGGGGYSPKVLDPARWKFGFIEDLPMAGYKDQVFEFTGPVGLVYGYYITNDASDVVRWAERFVDGPYEVLRTGDTVTVAPRARLPRMDEPKKEK
jgi:hypothetical protein